MFGSAFSPKILFAAFALFASAPVIAQEVEIATKNFSLKFPAGWSKFSLGNPSDSAPTIVMNSDLKATGFLVGVPHQGALTQAQINAAFAQFGGGDSLEKVDEGSKVLGGRNFAFLEYKDKSANADPDQRSRIYFVTEGNFLFETVIIYDKAAGAAAVPQLEAALATLKISASSGLRAVSGNTRPDLRPARHDLLGRSNLVLQRRTPLFRVPIF
ncbi:MAG: hypothetical protein M3Y08_15200 [Fibrobacterota bacterium]|nr:hypothetical protein [Fibrobacterota bacterium]